MITGSDIFALVVLIFSAILHEVAHGYVADRLGDPTARLMGRLTLDPRPHIDPFYTILAPLLLKLLGSPIIIGAAKPVPVDPFNLREGRKDMALVSLSGPLTNIVIAVIFSLTLRLLVSTSFSGSLASSGVLFDSMSTIININLLLGIFNLLPIPPLDGSKIFALLLPEEQASSYLSLGQLGLVLILILFFTPIGGFSLGQFLFNLIAFARSLLGP